MNIKLPRKRKKAFIKAKSASDYILACIANEVLYEDKPIKKHIKFPELVVERNKIKTLFYW